MFEIQTVVVTPFGQNARFLIDSGLSTAVAVDPGGEPERLLGFLRSKKVKLEQIWLSHSHLDHCGAVAGLLESFDAKLYGHAAEKEMRARVVEIGGQFGMPPRIMYNCPEPQVYLEGGEVLAFAGSTFQVLYTPGHSPGHVCFYCAEAAMAFVGDVIFAGSIGRTDLPGGSHDVLLRSIKEKILTLPDETRLLSGHGMETTVAAERHSNPFLQ